MCTIDHMETYLHEAAHVAPRKVVVKAIREDEQTCSHTTDIDIATTCFRNRSIPMQKNSYKTGHTLA